MSASAALQIAIIAAMKSSVDLIAALGGRIYDNAPDKAAYPHLTLGPAQEIDDSAECVDGVECFQQIDVWTQVGGSQLSAKQICGAVRKALHGADLELAEPYGLVLIEVQTVRFIGDHDDKLGRGIVTVRAIVEDIE